MNNKTLKTIITVQTVVMLGVLYLLWNQETNALISELTTLLILAGFSVAALGLAFVPQASKMPLVGEEGDRRDGTVKWFNPSKGFGFIEQDQGEDLFVHQSEIRQTGFRYLNQGDRVEFEVGDGKKGPVALDVIRTKAADPSEYPTVYNSDENAFSQAS